MIEYPSVHKSLEYAFPTSENATEHGFGKTGCYIVKQYTYDRSSLGYSATITHAFPSTDAGRDEAVQAWADTNLPVNVWSCLSGRHPEWFPATCPCPRGWESVEA